MAEVVSFVKLFCFAIVLLLTEDFFQPYVHGYYLGSMLDL